MATFTIRFFDSATHERVSDPEAHDTYSSAVCSEDGTQVFISVVGTAEYAHCGRGHAWQQTFGPSGWVQRE